MCLLCLKILLTLPTMKSLLTFFFLLVSVVCRLQLATAAFSESNPIYKFSTGQGLSSSVVYSVLQDDKGLIWIGTEEGLNRFDGRQFTWFGTSKGRYTLTHNRTQTLYKAPDGSIWAGTSDGLNIYDYQSDSIIKIRTDTKPLSLLYNDITFITQGEDNITWLGTYGDGVHMFDWKTKHFSRLNLPVLQSLPRPLFVMNLLYDDDRRLWIGTRHDGLFCYHQKSRRLEYFELPEESRFVRTIFQDSFRRIWIGTTEGCYIYNETTNKLDVVQYPSFLGQTSIGYITEDAHGRIWIGTEMSTAGNNLIHFSVRSFSQFQPYNYQSISYGSSAGMLNCPSVNTLFADRDNNLWIGTAWGGLNMLRGIPPKFRLFNHESDIAGSLPNSPINALHADGNIIYIATLGTDRVGVGWFDIRTGKFTGLSSDPQLKHYVFQAILKDHQGNLWLGTYNKGLIKMDAKGRVLEHFTSKGTGVSTLPDNDIRAIYQSSIDRKLWISTSNGIACYDYATRKINAVSLFKNRTGVRCIKEDAKGDLWLGTYGDGVVQYQPAGARVITNPLGFNPGIVTDLLINNDTVWLATRSYGIIQFDTRRKNYKLYGESLIGSNDVRSLVRDISGQLWFGTPKGIGSLNAATGEIKKYNSQDGVQSGEFYDRTVAALPDGHLVFAGFGGMNIFHPWQVTKNDQCPPVVFTRLKIFNDIVFPSAAENGHKVLRENISTATEIVLQHHQTFFTLDFAGINYYANQKIQYAYLLEGFDPKWNDLGNQNSVSFRNLKPGKYILKVRASSPDEVWSENNIASIMIRVLPPFWKTSLAYLLYCLLAGIVIYAAWQFATIRIRANNTLKIERVRREQEEELHQEKIQFFTNISHEFRTPLTLLISPLEKMYQEEEQSERRLHFQLMLKNARRLQLMVNQLLDFRKAERGQMKLKIQQLELIALVRDITISFEDLSRERRIDFSFRPAVDSLMGWVDNDVITKTLVNLLSNAFKFTPPGGSISVGLCEIRSPEGDRQVQLKVADTGKGILSEDLPHIFDRFYQGQQRSGAQKGSGIGLHLTRSLVELHHGSIHVESRPGVSTVFTMVLPIGKASFDKEELMIDFESASVSIDKYEGEDGKPEPGQQGKTPHSGKRRILIVEDNEDIRVYIKSILGGVYKIEEAENGLIALEMAHKNEYDLIISDVMMPELDGMELCKQLKGSIETSHIPIILLTAKSEMDSRIEGLDVGAESYITKPFHPKHLLVRVARLIELRDLLKGRYSKKISLGDISGTPSTSPDELFMQKAIRIILDKMADSEFNGDLLAGEMGVSRMGLHRKIKAMTGQSTGEFIRNIRLKKAAELLKVQGRNVSEVCYDVGFSSPSYFTTCFAEVYKMTPSEYMKQFKEEN